MHSESTLAQGFRDLLQFVVGRQGKGCVPTRICRTKTQTHGMTQNPSMYLALASLPLVLTSSLMIVLHFSHAVKVCYNMLFSHSVPLAHAISSL